MKEALLSRFRGLITEYSRSKQNLRADIQWWRTDGLYLIQFMLLSLSGFATPRIGTLVASPSLNLRVYLPDRVHQSVSTIDIQPSSSLNALPSRLPTSTKGLFQWAVQLQRMRCNKYFRVAFTSSGPISSRTDLLDDLDLFSPDPSIFNRRSKDQFFHFRLLHSPALHPYNHWKTQQLWSPYWTTQSNTRFSMMPFRVGIVPSTE